MLWNITLDEWYKDAPVIVQVEDSQVELCSNMNDLFSITFNQIDRSLDIEPMDLADIGVWHFEWRSISEQDIVGRRINEIEVIEYEFRTTNPSSKKSLNGLGREAYSWLHGLGFNLDRGYVGVFNALDENDITFHRTTTEEFHYIGI
ncbi:hypothetical protein [Alicyclobacillus sp. SO9]|uniref:hypothetical protein n=1 Tax=Alicyclobacillus sp. SO9 TaxID=2665646 RepID=UPI0018E746F6|nr:hypothetical protein [Alicyclobacillus sp. SO9]QQE80624.1 hypothetical protein GI364_09610 [Alicyclobacillus sp. SO9]